MWHMKMKLHQCMHVIIKQIHTEAHAFLFVWKFAAGLKYIIISQYYFLFFLFVFFSENQNLNTLFSGVPISIIYYSLSAFIISEIGISNICSPNLHPNLCPLDYWLIIYMKLLAPDSGQSYICTSYPYRWPRKFKCSIFNIVHNVVQIGYSELAIGH